MAVMTAFSPAYGSGQLLTTGASSQEATLLSESQSVRIVNTDTTNPAYVKIGNGTVTATSSDTIVLPGQQMVLTKKDGDTKIAYLQSGGSAVLHVQCGEGKL